MMLDYIKPLQPISQINSKAILYSHPDITYESHHNYWFFQQALFKQQKAITD